VARSSETPAPTASARIPLDPLQLLTPATAGDLIRTRSTTLSGTLIAVSGRLETDPVACGPSKTCGAAVLIGSGSGITIRPMGDVGPGPWDGSGPMEGAFVLRLTGDTENGRATAEFVGRLTTPPSGAPGWFVQDIIEGAAHVEGSYAAVHGWLVRGPLNPCPSDPRNPPVSYGCPTDDWLSESEFQPLEANGQTVGPPASIYLSSGSYDRWAPDPAVAGFGGQGVEPREATYLLQFVSDGCNDVSVRVADCLPPPPRWRIVGRFDPIASAPTVTAPPPSASCLPTHHRDICIIQIGTP
jgi:hypothetical protein